VGVANFCPGFNSSSSPFVSFFTGTLIVSFFTMVVGECACGDNDVLMCLSCYYSSYDLRSRFLSGESGGGISYFHSPRDALHPLSLARARVPVQSSLSLGESQYHSLLGRDADAATNREMGLSPLHTATHTVLSRELIRHRTAAYSRVR
jgi:hypothetical protein